ncbi:Gfo/Idh/MocA family oxidoreductase [soil metagenome]
MVKDVHPLRVGIVGASPGKSWASRSHIPAIAALDSMTLTAVATSSAETARASAEQFGAKHWFVGIEDMVACSDVDLVIVAVKVPAHFDLAVAALEAGKHVYCEWPLGVDTIDAQHIADIARDSVGRNAIGLQARSSPTLRYMRDLIRSNFIGDIESASVVAYSSRGADPVTPMKEYLFDSNVGANLLTIEVGHLVDSVAFVLGEPDSSTTRLDLRRPVLTRSDGSELHPDTPDTFTSIMTTASGAVISVHLAQGSHSLVTTRISVLGSHGALQLSTTLPGGVQMSPLELWGADSATSPLRRLTPPKSYSQVNQPSVASAVNVAEALHAFGSDIRNGTVTAPTFLDAVARHQSLDRIMPSRAALR